MEIKKVYLQEGLNMSDELLDNINKLDDNESVFFIFKIPILSITRTQPISKFFFMNVCELYGIEKSISKLFGLFRYLYDIDSKCFIFTSNNQLGQYKNIVKHNLELSNKRPKIHLLDNGKIIIEGMKSFK
jgi:hypothetical protein